MISAILITLLIIILIVNLLVVISFNANFKTYSNNFNELPKVSILLAVRNEEQNLKRCLDSLIALDYPKDKMQILIGDDDSTDQTAEVIKNYQDQFDFVKGIEIKKRIGKQKGKANALAHLAHMATGDYYLITDADMSLSKQWVNGLLSSMDKNIGLSIGTTSVIGNKMQNLDWLFALGMVKTVTDLDRPVNGMGNNMIVSKEAYWSVGGYDEIPFSITEDFELFKFIKNKGFQCKHVFNEDVLGITLPVKGYINLLNQRKRWMQGALELPLHMVVLLGLQACFYPVLVLLFFFSITVSVTLLLIKVVVQIINIHSIHSKLKSKVSWTSIIQFEFYSMVISLSTIIYFLLPIKVKWKGRTY